MFTVVHYPPGREETSLFSCKEKPEFFLSEESGLHTLMVRFTPSNGPAKGLPVVTPAAHVLVESPG